jgi:hypothetical protein
MSKKEKGAFVSVGDHIGVIVKLSEEDGTPEEHLGIWYGETNEMNVPKYRTVPEEYCILVEQSEDYH